MSLLPERKKTAEEIARLREQMGLPTAAASAPAFSPPAAPPEDAAPESPAAAEEPPPAQPVRIKKMNSLKHSERQPVFMVPKQVADSPLPARRRSESELDELRRREALSALGAGPPPAIVHLQARTAHRGLLAVGYLLVLASAAGTWREFFQIPPREGLWLAFGGIGVSWLFAALVAWRKPLSRHHAGFIAAVAGLVLVFALLYYFPNLNPAHAS